jgi:prepilin-type N-terminal cleavage/methylation domain-containing protein
MEKINMTKKQNFRSNGHAFTLIELLVVIAIIALLLAILVPALGRAKLFAQRIICGTNIRQQCLGVILYSQQFDGNVPIHKGDTSYWFWDLSFWTSNQICLYAGIDYKTFFCPANTYKKMTDARFWQYSWLTTTPAAFGVTLPCSREVSLKDESVLTATMQQGYYRVVPQVFMLDKLDGNGNSKFGTSLATGEPAKWIRKISDIKNASASILVMDAVISENPTGPYKFENITTGGVDDFYPPLTDCSNHMSRQAESVLASYKKPAGGNVGSVDGNVRWRDFGSTTQNSTMRYRIRSLGNGPCFWW